MPHNLAVRNKNERQRINLDLLALGVVTEPTYTISSIRSAMSEERTLRIPANIGSEQSELNLAIHCEFPTAFAASLIQRNF